MKKFQFSLCSVLDYKRQALDALMGEHAAALEAVRRQEAALAAEERRYADQNQRFREKKAAGVSASEARLYESGLRALEAELRREAEQLAKLRRREEEKRAQVIEAKKESSSLEKLRDKKLDDYQKACRKDEERLIDEFVSLGRIIGDGA